MISRFRGRNRFSRVAVTTIVVTGLAITAFLAHVVKGEEDRRLRSQFERLAADRVRSLNGVVQTSLVHVQSVRALFSSSVDVDRYEFRSFVEPFLASKRHILAWEWIPVVPKHKRAEFEAGARRSGFPDYAIRSLDERDDAEFYYPVLFTEPIETNESHQGMDYGSVASFMEAIEAAGDQDRPAATRIISIGLGDRGQDVLGVQLFVPVRNAVHTTDRPKRTHELAGLVSVVLAVDEMVEASLANLTPAGVDISLYEDASDDRRRRAYTHPSRARRPSDPFQAPPETWEEFVRAAPALHASERIHVAGRTWWMTVTPAPQFYGFYETSTWRLVAVGGAALTTLLGYLVLLTLRRLMEGEEKARLHLAAVVESSADAIYTKNLDGVVTSWNAAAERLFGYKAREIIGQSAIVLHPWDLKTTSIFSELSRDTRVQRYETVRVRKDGQPVDVSLSISPIHAHGSLVEAAVIAQDITERKRVEKMKDEFIYLASHQLRTPLTNVRLYAEMLLDGHASELQPLQREFVEVIDDNTRRMVDLVTTLLNISRIEGATMMVHPEPHDMGHLLRQALSEILMRMEAKSIRLDQDVDADLPLVNVDPVIVREIFSNLLSNALKYTPEGGSVAVSLYRDKGEIVTRMMDTGYGIPRKDRKNVFSRFYRGENVIAHEAEGTGLGLYLVKSLCDLSGCRIWFESEEGAGTTFWLAVPLDGMHERVGSGRLESIEYKKEEKAWLES